MSFDNWLREAETQLHTAGIATARLDALILLEDVSNKDRTYLLAYPEEILSPKQIKILNDLLTQRLKHVPISHIIGRSEFYGRNFVINHHVLQPRPESETMIDNLKELFTNSTLKYSPTSYKSAISLADVGAGSGALGITAKLELPDIEVDLIELEQEAIEVSKINVAKFTLNITIIKNDLLNNIGKHYDIILCNLPYVPDGYAINSAASHEPKIAIFGGRDGLDVYRKMFVDLNNDTRPPLYILSEALPVQHMELEKLANAAGYYCIREDDFIQTFQFTDT
jgi:release factor glutamine methyltransferase